MLTIMKRISKIYKKFIIVCAVLCGTVMSSCTDYLTIIPPGIITEENYWQTKDDVNGLMAKAYLDLLSSDAVQKAIIWGELRADNMTYPANYSKDIKYIVEANILDENGYTNWAVYYKAIQTANLVIERAPQVVEHDPDFTEGDLQVVMGEMYALRALAHFYLVRTFRDIPMALKAVSNDGDMPQYSQVHPIEALNLIMADLDKAQGMVMKSGNFATPSHNFGRITENAVLAMKADVNLWRAAFATYYEGQTDLVAAGDVQKYYDLCVQNCQDVLDRMSAKYEESIKDKNNVDRFPYDLLQNEGELEDRTDEHLSTVYEEIFGSKNSRESIFELQVERSNVTSGWAKGVANMYGTDGNHGAVVVPSSFLSKNYEKDDLRAYSFTNAKSLSGNSNTQGSGGSSNEVKDIIIAKYSAKSSAASDFRKADDYDANWIIYRKTDVMLMMAEAMVARPSADVEDFSAAFEIVRVINTRSRMDSTNISKPLNERNYQTRDAIRKLVLDERLRELTYEGKRWYDLVRKALREKTTNDIKFVADKLDSNSGVVKSKMSTIDGLFMPIYIDELRYNKLLKQNPAYKDEDEKTEMN